MSDTELVEKAIVRADKVPNKVRSSEPVKNTRRKITDMSVEEKNAIITDILNGKEHEHYDLKAFKKGKLIFKSRTWWGVVLINVPKMHAVNAQAIYSP